MRFISSIVLSLALFVVYFQSNVFAENTIDPRLEELAGKYDVEFVPLEDNQVKSDQLLSFKDFNEYELYLADMIRQVDEIDKSPKLQLEVTPNLNYSLLRANQEATKTISWHAPFSGWGFTGLATWKNVTVTYSYDTKDNYPYFTGVSSIKSYVSGFQVLIDWHQTGASKTYSETCKPKDTANFTIDGYYLLGAEIGGIAIGAKINETWTPSLQINPPGRGCF